MVLNFVRNKQLSQEQRLDLRIFYWAAYYGRVEAVKLMIELFRWSPMIKSFKKRDILSAAILGQQENVVAYLVNKNYKGKTAQED